MKSIDQINVMIKDAKESLPVEYKSFLDGVVVSWNKRLYSAFGRAWSMKGKIEFSVPLLINDKIDETEIKDTILHEIAHVIAGRKYGHNCGHSVKWQQIAVDIGCNGKRCGKYIDIYRYDVVCQKHGKIGARNRKCSKLAYCSRCMAEGQSIQEIAGKLIHVKREEV